MSIFATFSIPYLLEYILKFLPATDLIKFGKKSVFNTCKEWYKASSRNSFWHVCYVLQYGQYCSSTRLAKYTPEFTWRSMFFVLTKFHSANLKRFPGVVMYARYVKNILQYPFLLTFYTYYPKHRDSLFYVTRTQRDGVVNNGTFGTIGDRVKVIRTTKRVNVPLTIILTSILLSLLVGYEARDLQYKKYAERLTKKFIKTKYKYFTYNIDINQIDGDREGANVYEVEDDFQGNLEGNPEGNLEGTLEGNPEGNLEGTDQDEFQENYLNELFNIPFQGATVVEATADQDDYATRIRQAGMGPIPPLLQTPTSSLSHMELCRLTEQIYARVSKGAFDFFEDVTAETIVDGLYSLRCVSPRLIDNIHDLCGIAPDRDGIILSVRSSRDLKKLKYLSDKFRMNFDAGSWIYAIKWKNADYVKLLFECRVLMSPLDLTTCKSREVIEFLHSKRIITTQHFDLWNKLALQVAEKAQKKISMKSLYYAKYTTKVPDFRSATSKGYNSHIMQDI